MEEEEEGCTVQIPSMTHTSLASSLIYRTRMSPYEDEQLLKWSRDATKFTRYSTAFFHPPLLNYYSQLNDHH